MSADHFCHIGADFLPDAEGGCWLLESNCPPCMGSQTEADARGRADDMAARTLLETQTVEIMKVRTERLVVVLVLLMSRRGGVVKVRTA